MAIIRKPGLSQLFNAARRNDGPRVHNKHHGTAPVDAVYIGRGSQWGNPYVIGKHGNRHQVIEEYRRHILPTLDLSYLKGKHLVCFCKPLTCHGDYLLIAANKE